MASPQTTHIRSILALGALLGLSRWFLPLADIRGRSVIIFGFGLIAINLAILHYRLLRRMQGARPVSRILLGGILAASIVIISAVSLPSAFADGPAVDPIDPPLNTLASVEAASTDLATAGWLFLLAAVSVQLWFAPQPRLRPVRIERL